MKRPLVVNILLYDANAGEGAVAEQDLVVDIRGTTARTWLSNYIAWAAHDNKVVEIEPAPGKRPNFIPRNKT